MNPYAPVDVQAAPTEPPKALGKKLVAAAFAGLLIVGVVAIVVNNNGSSSNASSASTSASATELYRANTYSYRAYTPFPPYITSGTCESNGYANIYDAGECLAAAKYAAFSQGLTISGRPYTQFFPVTELTGKTYGGAGPQPSGCWPSPGMQPTDSLTFSAEAGNGGHTGGGLCLNSQPNGQPPSDAPCDGQDGRTSLCLCKFKDTPAPPSYDASDFVIVTDGTCESNSQGSFYTIYDNNQCAQGSALYTDDLATGNLAGLGPFSGITQVNEKVAPPGCWPFPGSMSFAGTPKTGNQLCLNVDANSPQPCGGPFKCICARKLNPATDGTLPCTKTWCSTGDGKCKPHAYGVGCQGGGELYCRHGFGCLQSPLDLDLNQQAKDALRL